MAPPKHPVVSFSGKRERLWQSCRRCWWYEYVGSYWPTTTEGHALRLRKKASSISLLLGDIVHEAISLWLHSHKTPDAKTPGRRDAQDAQQAVDDALARVSQRVRGDLDDARRAADRPEEIDHRAFFLLASVRGEPVDLSADVENDLIELATEHLRTVVDYRGAPGSWLEHGFGEALRATIAAGRAHFIEPFPTNFDAAKFQHPDVHRGKLDIFSMPDFVLETDDDRWVVIDWKTAGAWRVGDKADDQLLLQALRTHHKMQAVRGDSCPTLLMEAYTFHTTDSQWVGGAVHEESFAPLLARIHAHCAEVMQAQGGNERMPVEVCPPTPSSSCSRCPYHDVCDAGLAAAPLMEEEQGR